MFEKIVSFITIVAALWGATLSTVIYVKNERNKTPDMAVSLSILRTSSTASSEKSEANKAKFRVNVINVGESGIELNPSISILAHNKFDKSRKNIELKLEQENTKDIFNQRQLHTYLAPGQEASFISGEYSENESVKLYNTHIVLLESEGRPFIATILPPKSGELNHHQLLNSELMNQYPMNISFSPQKATEL